MIEEATCRPPRSFEEVNVPESDAGEVLATIAASEPAP